MSKEDNADLIAAMSDKIEDLQGQVDALTVQVEATEAVTLREWDFSAGPSGGFVERRYSFGPIKRFVEWFNNTSQWKESPEMAYKQWLRFTRDLTDERNDAALKAAKAAKAA
jgi:hypothetical protein